MTAVPFRLIDAFAEQPHTGNPAGVVFEADQLTAEQMQLIAREVNASETAFISRLSDLHRPPRLRWFTPAAEVDFCGHATLAAAHAVWELNCLPSARAQNDPHVTFESAAGELRIVPEMLPDPFNIPLWWLGLPTPRLTPDNTNPIRTCQLLGISIDDLDDHFPVTRTQDNDLIFFVKNCPTLFGMQPRFDELAEWCRRFDIRGICVATRATLVDSVAVQSRFFAPAVGVNEDPVTGSVHGPLVAMLIQHGVVPNFSGHAGFNCLQGRSGDRGGLLRALVQPTDQGCHVRLGGLCWTTIVGEITVPSLPDHAS